MRIYRFDRLELPVRLPLAGMIIFNKAVPWVNMGGFFYFNRRHYERSIPACKIYDKTIIVFDLRGIGGSGYRSILFDRGGHYVTGVINRNEPDL